MEESKERGCFIVATPEVSPDEISGPIQIRQIVSIPGNLEDRRLCIVGKEWGSTVHQLALVSYWSRVNGRIDAVLPVVIDEETGKLGPAFNAKLEYRGGIR